MSYSSEVLADSPTGFFHLDEASGTVADDATNTADGTYSGTPIFSATGVVGTAVRSQSTGSGYFFVPVSGLTTAWSLEFWYKYDSASGSVIWRDNSSSNGWLMQFINSDADLRVRSAGTDRTITGAGTTLRAAGSNSGWHHVVMTSSGTSIVTYIDKTAVDTWARTVNASTVNTNIRFGRNGSLNTFYNAYYDEVAVYGAVLASGRVTAHYDTAIPQIVAGGLVSVTNSALAGSVIAGSVLSGGIAAVTASVAAGVVLAGSLITGGQVSTSSTALAGLVTGTSVVGGQASTLSTALGGVASAGATVTGGQATTTSTGRAGTVAQATTGGQVATTSSGQAGYAYHRVLGGQVATTVTVVGGTTGSTNISGGTVTVTANALAGVVALSYTLSDTSNDDDGVYIGDGYAEVVWDSGVVAIPAHLSLGEVRVVAHAITEPPGVGEAFVPAGHEVASIPGAIDRVVIDGQDFTFYGGAAAVVEGVKLIDPLLYGSAHVTLPAVNPQFPDDDLGDLVERFKFARVRIQRVLDGVVISTDHKGFVSRVDTSGTSLGLEVGGEAAGALSQMYVTPPVYRRKQDVEHIVADLLRDARVRAKEHDGPTGIGIIRRGGSDGLTIVNETIAVWAGASGNAVTWTPNARGQYRNVNKNTTTIDATAYIDSSLVSQDLAQDFMEQYTRVYAHGFTAAGELVTNIKTPGLTQGDAPDFPLPSGLLELGMADADTDSGAGITAVQQQLLIHNYLDYSDVDAGTYDAETAAAVRAFQRDAGLNVTGEVGENAWDALWDLASIGYSLDEAREYPMAQDPRTFKWFRTANGSKIRRNPDYDPLFIPNDVFIDVGGPHGKGQIRDFARSKLVPDEGMWSGTLTFNSGLISGEHSPGDPLTADDVMDRRDLLPNMRLKLPWFGGTEAGIVVHVAGVDHGQESTQCLVSTLPETTMEVWEALERRREAKSNPGRAWSGHTRASQVRNDIAAQWDTSSGWIANDVALDAGWNEIKVPAGQSGIVQRLRVQLEVPRESAMLLTQRPVSLDALNNNPHTATPLTDPRPTRPWWEQEAVEAWLEGRGYLDAWGTERQPCGYDPSLKTDDLGDTGQSPTGLTKEVCGFNYETGVQPVLFLYVWVAEGNVLQAGRILRNQRTTDI